MWQRPRPPSFEEYRKSVDAYFPGHTTYDPNQRTIALGFIPLESAYPRGTTKSDNLYRLEVRFPPDFPHVRPEIAILLPFVRGVNLLHPHLKTVEVKKGDFIAVVSSGPLYKWDVNDTSKNGNLGLILKEVIDALNNPNEPSIRCGPLSATPKSSLPMSAPAHPKPSIPSPNLPLSFPKLEAMSLAELQILASTAGGAAREAFVASEASYAKLLDEERMGVTTANRDAECVVALDAQVRELEAALGVAEEEAREARARTETLYAQLEALSPSRRVPLILGQLSEEEEKWEAESERVLVVWGQTIHHALC